MRSATRTKPIRQRRRWLQFSLRALAIAVVLISLPFCWLAAQLQHKRMEQKAVMAIQAANGWVRYDFEDSEPVGANSPTPELPGPKWLHPLLGSEFFTNVIAVTISNSSSPDDGLEHLTAFPHLQRLSLEWCGVTESGLAHLEATPDLQVLTIRETPIADGALKHLNSLRSLRELTVSGASVTDDGVAHLKGLSSIQKLDLSRNLLTDVGLGQLAAFADLKELNLAGTSISDAGSRHLAGFTRLERLDLSETEVSDVGLEQVRALANLTELNVALTRVTEDGANELRLVLPGCFVTYSTLPNQAAKPQPSLNRGSFRLDGPFGSKPPAPSDAADGDPFGRPGP